MVPHWFPKNKVKDIGVFRNFHKLADGGFGEVFACDWFQSSENKAVGVVIKRCKPYFQENDFKRKERFLREAQIMKQLSHPAIPRYIDGFVSEEDCFFIIERVDGIDLEKCMYNANLSKSQPSLRFALFVMVQLFQVLEYLHHFKNGLGEQMPIIHGDLKPKNIMIDYSLRVKLIDFTNALILGENQSFLGASLAYAPPEFFLDGIPTLQSDIYSASVVLFTLLTFRPLLKNNNNQFAVFGQQLENRPLDRVKRADIPDCVKECLVRGLSFKPEERFDSVAEYHQALLDCIRELKLNTEDRDKIHQETSRFFVIH